eukprot:GILJ01003705.1.p1 GENE.GILJ01003705.1~~GILJ01003705.1.p1  ORF type:complete len:316 (-),score=36.38 GILJ01003705.1:59-1006(-)
MESTVNEDEGTYWGRVRRTAAMLDMTKAFISDNQLENALSIVKRRREGDMTITETQFQEAMRIKEAVIHPDTGEKIRLPLRVSCIIPANMVLDCCMIQARTFGQTVLAQWLNQSYNACHYFANKNASNPQPDQQVMQAYFGATASSVLTAVGLNKLADRAKASWTFTPLLRKTIPFWAVAAADILNLRTMRQDEIVHGVQIRQPDGHVVGVSQEAGNRAVWQCIAGRVFAAAPILLIPPMVMHKWEQRPLLLRRPWLHTPIMLGLVGLAIQVSVPLCFGLFKQTATVSVLHLEDRFHHLKDSQGNPLVVSYNKGI